MRDCQEDMSLLQEDAETQQQASVLANGDTEDKDIIF